MLTGGAWRGWSWRQRWALAFSLLAVALLAVVALRASGSDSSTDSPNAGPTTTVSNGPPPPSGYFSLLPVRVWSSLPSDAACASRVHSSVWEPRPDNYAPNHHEPNQRMVHRAFAIRPRSTERSHDARWDSWLLPRVDGQFTGTTDEIFQWAACKWGLPDNLLRAIAVQESTWFQNEVYPKGRPVTNWGSGDLFTRATRASRDFCDELAEYGRNYQRDYGAGRCPRTFSIVGVMSWEAPDWGRMAGNQNGTFPFNRNSTALAVDYLASQLRGCYQGWERWLEETGTGNYSAGRIWGCVGAWYSGTWHSSAANAYISGVKEANRSLPWLQPDWPDISPPCSKRYGCPRGR
jgi:hypothetical protein